MNFLEGKLTRTIIIILDTILLHGTSSMQSVNQFVDTENDMTTSS